MNNLCLRAQLCYPHVLHILLVRANDVRPPGVKLPRFRVVYGYNVTSSESKEQEYIHEMFC